MQVLLPSDAALILDSLQMDDWLDGVSDRRGKIARMMRAGQIIPLRRGLYASRSDANPLCLAGTIYGPSYVSFESALAWHGLIPEAVVEVISATPRRAATFENSFGRFRYRRIPLSVYPVGVMRITEAEVPFLLASVTKSLCDRIANEPGFRSMTDVRRWIEAMRVDEELALDENELRQCAEGYGRPSVRWLHRAARKYDWIGR